MSTLSRRPSKEEFLSWPEDARKHYLALAERRAEITGLPPSPRAWPGPPETTVRRYFPSWATSPFAAHHTDFWNYVWEVEPGERSRPLVMIVNRKGAKTSTAEMSTVLLGAYRRRRYCLYVRARQQDANAAVDDIATLMRSPQLVADFPELARVRPSARKTEAFTLSRIRAKGILVDGIGLDAAARGVKFGELRPDWIIIDDVDGLHDGPAAVRKKLETLTHTVIPTGSRDVCVVFIQNLIHPNSVAAHLTHPIRFPEEERFLLDRKLIGPIPAIEDFEAQMVVDPGDPSQRVWRITGGRPTWSGFNLRDAEAELNTTNRRAFEIEYQHLMEPPEGNVFSHIEFSECDWDEVPWDNLVDLQVWVDPATSDSDGADAMGICASGVTRSRHVYHLWAWERVTTPTDALERAFLQAFEVGASTVGIETDNGGDAWLSVAREALDLLRKAGRVPEDWQPRIDTAKAGRTGKTKHERLATMIQPLERGRHHLVRGSTAVLKRSLIRYTGTAASKPWDVLDAAWHAADQLERRPFRQMKSRTPAASQRPEYRPREYEERAGLAARRRRGV